MLLIWFAIIISVFISTFFTLLLCIEVTMFPASYTIWLAILCYWILFLMLWRDAWRQRQHWDTWRRSIPFRLNLSVWRTSSWLMGSTKLDAGRSVYICPLGTPNWSAPIPRLMVFLRDFPTWRLNNRGSLGRRRISRLWPLRWICEENIKKVQCKSLLHFYKFILLEYHSLKFISIYLCSLFKFIFLYFFNFQFSNKNKTYRVKFVKEYFQIFKAIFKRSKRVTVPKSKCPWSRWAYASTSVSPSYCSQLYIFWIYFPMLMNRQWNAFLEEYNIWLVNSV